jgi:osmoprotectant transport system permease protein
MLTVRTSAIIGIGTATLAALIGAEGYGAPIVIGLALNDIELILTGAVPAAIMALLTHAAFEALSRIFTPKGIR